MIKLFTNKQKLDRDNLLEISQYRKEIDAITLLRDKARTQEEQDRYSNMLEIMQKVLERLLAST